MDKTYTIHINDLEFQASVGVLDHEKLQSQRVVMDIALTSVRPKNIYSDDYGDVVCYASIINKVATMLSQKHIELIETMAAKVTDICLEDSRILKANVKVVKPDIIPNAEVGVELIQCTASTA